MEPDESLLPGGASPYRMMFGRDQLDDIAPALDDEAVGAGVERTIEDQRYMAREERESGQEGGAGWRRLQHVVGARRSIGVVPGWDVYHRG